MVRILLNRAIEDAEDIERLLPFVVEHKYLAQAMLLVTVYVQLFALMAVFRPHLHRPFGIAIILFHIGSAWVMGVPFTANILMIGLFLVLSPTAPARLSLLGIMQSLPIFGIRFVLGCAFEHPANVDVSIRRGSSMMANVRSAETTHDILGSRNRSMNSSLLTREKAVRS